MMIVNEFIFLIDFLTKFFLSFTESNSLKTVEEFNKIVPNYLKNGCLTDMIPLIPLQLIQLKNNRNCLFYLIKLIRL